MSTEQLREILQALDEEDITAVDLLLSLLSNDDLSEHPATAEIAQRIREILDAMKNNEKVRPGILEWAHKQVLETYASEIGVLIRKATGYRFSAKRATAERLEGIDIEEMAKTMQTKAPALWSLLDILLDANTEVAAVREKRRAQRAAKKGRKRRPDKDGDVEMGFAGDIINEEDLDDDPEEAAYWETVGNTSDIFNVNETDRNQSTLDTDKAAGDEVDAGGSDSEDDAIDTAAERRKALIMIVSRPLCFRLSSVV